VHGESVHGDAGERVQVFFAVLAVQPRALAVVKAPATGCRYSSDATSHVRLRKKYLDALAGIAVNGLGHAHPKLVAALADQAAS